MAVILPRALQARIHDQLRATYPNEGGGFLLGHSHGNGLVTVADVQPVENVFESEEQHHRYAMTPADWVRMEDEAEARGLQLVGYYHSHPDHPAVPSEYDRAHAWPNFLYLIVSVRGGQAVETRAWRLAEDRAAFDVLALQVL